MPSCTLPSDYWREELAGFDYLLEASPLLIQKLRQHTFHLTGLKTYDYRSSQVKRKEEFKQKLKELRKADSNNLFVPESPILGGFGHNLDGQLVNLDTLKFYESLIALDKGQVLSALRGQKKKPVVCEIGAGWGGFPYQLKQHVPNMTYVIVDFPEVFLFSAVYLMTAFPDSRVLFVDGKDAVKEFRETTSAYDFVFVPQESFQEIWDVPLDLAINMVSFQEMTTGQVEGYARKLWEGGVTKLYSHNRDRSGHNAQLSLVSEILSHYFELQRIVVLNGPYTDLNSRFVDKKEKSPASSLRLAGRLIKRALLSLRNQNQLMPSEYRHLIGSPLKGHRNED